MKSRCSALPSSAFLVGQRPAANRSQVSARSIGVFAALAAAVEEDARESQKHENERLSSLMNGSRTSSLLSCCSSCSSALLLLLLLLQKFLLRRLFLSRPVSLAVAKASYLAAEERGSRIEPLTHNVLILLLFVLRRHHHYNGHAPVE